MGANRDEEQFWHPEKHFWYRERHTSPPITGTPHLSLADDHRSGYDSLRRDHCPPRVAVPRTR
ncbi:MAG TPA: hypothetical protein VEJ84_24110, partial [Acidimicrobiales bacterium]|nr:hypothetical protein [Acidimicrobiales bacterium]